MPHLIPRIALHSLAAQAPVHKSPPLEPPVSYRNDSRDEDCVPQAHRASSNECATPAQQASKFCDDTLALTPWNPSDVWPVRGDARAAVDAERAKGGEGQVLLRRLQALGCEQRLIEACNGQGDLEALLDIVSGRFDSRNSPSRSAALLGAPGSLAGAQEAMHKKVGAARVFPAAKGESMAHIHIYSIRHVPPFSPAAGSSDPSDPGSMGAPDILCHVACGDHEATTSPLPSPAGATAVFNERFDFGVDIRNPHAQVGGWLSRISHLPAAGLVPPARERLASAPLPALALAASRLSFLPASFPSQALTLFPSRLSPPPSPPGELRVFVSFSL